MCSIAAIRDAYQESTGTYGSLAFDSLFERGFGESVRIYGGNKDIEWNVSDLRYLKASAKKKQQTMFLSRDVSFIKRVEEFAKSPKYSYADAARELGRFFRVR